MVTPGIDSGQPAASTASRPTLVDWSAIWVTQPQTTSSISSGSSRFLAASAVSTDADRSTGWTPLERPLAAADGRTHRVYDYGITHEQLLPVALVVRPRERSRR